MQKIYVLLRNDRQTGPYSLEEIIRFDLKPYDLIWIQGRSAGWYYPQEIAALHPYLSFLPKKQQPASETKPQSVFVSQPQTTQPVEPPFIPPVTPVYTPAEPVSTAPVSGSATALEEAVYAQFRKPPQTEESAGRTPAMPGNQTKKPVRPAVVGLLTVLIIGGVFAASWMLNRKDSDARETPAAFTTDLPAQTEITGAPAQQATGTQNPSSPQSQLAKKPRTGTITPKRTAAVIVPVTTPSTTVSDDPVEVVYDQPGTGTANEPPVTGRVEEAPADRSSETAAPKEEKKKLRDKLFDIFRKKPADASPEENRPAENSNGERTATRREESANLAQMVHVRFDVPNDWMMGIHGAKATLVNRSNETVQKATVEVLYYDDDNQLLQKRTIGFDKVSGKGSKTIAIPDHPTATKVDYSIVSVSGKPAA